MPATPAHACPRCGKPVLVTNDLITGQTVYLEPELDQIGLEILTPDGLTCRHKTVPEAARGLPGHHEHLRPGTPTSACRNPPPKTVPQHHQQPLFA